jgi:hypothetical protein
MPFTRSLPPNDGNSNDGRITTSPKKDEDTEPERGDSEFARRVYEDPTDTAFEEMLTAGVAAFGENDIAVATIPDGR